MTPKSTLHLVIGESHTPTRYNLKWLEGGGFHVRCGADLLLNGLKADLEAYARCPICEEETHFRVVRRRIENLQPDEAVLHVVEIPTMGGRIGIECEATHIFDKEVCLGKWTSEYNGKRGLVPSLPDYLSSLNKRLLTRNLNWFSYSPG